MSLCVRRKHGMGVIVKIYAETDTSFEVSGAPLATAAKDTESLWGSTGTGVDTIVS